MFDTIPPSLLRSVQLTIRGSSEVTQQLNNVLEPVVESSSLDKYAAHISRTRGNTCLRATGVHHCNHIYMQVNVIHTRYGTVILDGKM